jgi:hypothetical protein
MRTLGPVSRAAVSGEERSHDSPARAIAHPAVAGHRLDGIAVGPRPASPVVQRVKTDEERSEKQSRVARAQRTIALLGNNLNANLDGHVFEALPAEGGEADKSNPGGLHAYTDGALPGGITGTVVAGSPTKVHTLRWNWNGNAAQKLSTMFPNWMPREHVRTLIQLKYKETSAVSPPEETPLYPDLTRTHILRGMDITLAKAGSTVYPTG